MDIKRLLIVLSLVLVPLAFASAETPCPPPLAWAMSWQGPGRSSEVFYSVAPDGTGGAVAVGYETRSDLWHGKSWIVARYGGDGKVLWTTAYVAASRSENVAQSVVLDVNGQITVAGWEERGDRPTFSNVLVRRHSADGRILWSREYDGAAHGNDRAYAVAGDAAGSVLVAGTEALRSGSCWLILKYDSKGTLKWGRTCGGRPGMSASARALASGRDGGFFVAGSEQVGGFDYDWVLRKFDKHGDILWTRTLSGEGSGWDEAHAVAAYPGGGVLVAGRVQQAGIGSRYSWCVARFTADGGLAWSRTGPGLAGPDTRAFSAVVDPCGRAVVAGCIGGQPVAGSGRGYMLAAEYGPYGEVLCTWTGTGSAGGPACAMGAGADRLGNTYISGYEVTGEDFRDIHALISRYSRPPCPEPVPAAVPRAKR